MPDDHRLRYSSDPAAAISASRFTASRFTAKSRFESRTIPAAGRHGPDTSDDRMLAQRSSRPSRRAQESTAVRRSCWCTALIDSVL